jgi:hypothetical protein
MFRLDRYIDSMDSFRENFIINLNTIVYLSVTLSYIVPSSYCSYPAYLLRQLRIVLAIAVHPASTLRGIDCYTTK